MKIAIGDRLWIPRTGNTQTQKPCPVCFGKLAVTIILGDDSRIGTMCDYCGKGFDGPTGVESVYERLPGAELFVVAEIRTVTTEDGESSEYTTANCRLARDGNLYATEQEAIEASKDLQKEQIEYDEKRAEIIKGNVHKSFSWNVGYHRREAKRLREKIEYHERKAFLCEERVK